MQVTASNFRDLKVVYHQKHDDNGFVFLMLESDEKPLSKRGSLPLTLIVDFIHKTPGSAMVGLACAVIKAKLSGCYIKGSTEEEIPQTIWIRQTTKKVKKKVGGWEICGDMRTLGGEAISKKSGEHSRETEKIYEYWMAKVVRKGKTLDFHFRPARGEPFVSEPRPYRFPMEIVPEVPHESDTGPFGEFALTDAFKGLEFRQRDGSPVSLVKKWVMRALIKKKLKQDVLVGFRLVL